MVGRLLFLLLALYTVCGDHPSAACPDYMFPCNNGQCVLKSFWCDTSEDCFDGTDEKYCAYRTSANANPNGCDESFFLCKIGTCIPKSGRCDGHFSCPDNSDEENCDTTTHAINGTVISLDVAPLTELEAAATPQPPVATFEATTLEHYRDVSQHDKSVAQNTSESKPLGGDQYSAPEVYIASENTSDSNEASKNTSHSNEASKNTSHSNEASKHDDLGSMEISDETLKHDDHVTYSSTSQEALDGESLKQDDHGIVQADSTVTRNNDDKDFNRQPHDIDETNHVDDSKLPNDPDKDSNRHDVPPDFIEKGLKHKFLEINSQDYRIQRSSAQKWLLKVRDEDFGWDDETARAVTALYVSSDDLKVKQSEKLLMSNQLNLRLFAALMRNVTKPISLAELALYINALSVSCENPRNFYGHDLVDTLRQRTDVAHKSNLVVPFVYLALCLNNATSHADVEKLHKFLHGTGNIDKIGIEAMVFLATTCMYRSLQWPDPQHGLATRFLDKIRIQGFPENVYDLALMAQALNEARINQDLWNRSEVMNRIIDSQHFDGSFGDILSTYYVMPLLSGRSLASFNQHCQHEDKSLVPVEVLKNGKTEKYAINYILRYGDPMEMSQTLQLQVKKSSSLFDIMRISETLNPSYRFKYVMSHGKPCVYSIGEMVNDAEKGVYWSLYIGSHYHNDTAEDLALFEGDIRSFIPSWGQYVVFWLKSVF